MSQMGQLRKFGPPTGIDAQGHNRSHAPTTPDRRRRLNSTSFDIVVRIEQKAHGQLDAQCFGGLHVNDKAELG